ncbi:unnamed protein product, partial [Mesorhabditis belari]|uniref:PSP proline-rich domain-containing protein n=1 Tax=Mesorhabditis belari TaxID=2138241 RepID=A0AAF3EYK7_9BILA
MSKSKNDNVISLDDDADENEEGEIILSSDDEKSEEKVITIDDDEMRSDSDGALEETPSPAKKNKLLIKKSRKRPAPEKISDEVIDIHFEQRTEIVETPKNVITTKRTQVKAKKAKNEADGGVCEEYGDFVLDRVETTTTSIDVGEEEEPGEIASAWRESLLKKILTPIAANDTESASKSNRKRPSIQCWNCDGDHNLQACPEKRNGKKIAEARRSFQEMKQKNETPDRYHTEEATTSDKFRPGRISDALRKAMGLGRDDLPEHIYRMRKMGFVNGYPPGYLKKALVKSEDGETLSFIMDAPPSMAAKIIPTTRKGADPPKVDQKKDREKNFNIPPFDIFIEMLQEEQNRLFKEAKREKAKQVPVKSSRTEQLRVKEEVDMDVDRVNGDADEVRSIQSIGDEKNEDESISEMFTIDTQPTATPETPKGKVLSDVVETPKLARGSSTSIISGTPVIQYRSSVTGNLIESGSLPDISAFAAGVQPFERNEEVSEKKGFFKKAFASIKEKFLTKKPNLDS